ncbi:MAG: hypothetical protein PHW90_03485 [Bacilli bacterium]|jgi:hypothetical protein|nr:hypothetical protein [Bacilli bacterium]
MLRKIKSLWNKHQYSKEYEKYEDTYEFIWGIKSANDLSYSEANLYTMNDISITYDKESKMYSISIKTIYYEFTNGKDGEKSYIKHLFDRLTEWMIAQGYSINKEVDIYDVFTAGNNINTEYESIEDLYSNFKFLVEGFCD